MTKTRWNQTLLEILSLFYDGLTIFGDLNLNKFRNLCLSSEEEGRLKRGARRVISKCKSVENICSYDREETPKRWTLTSCQSKQQWTDSTTIRASERVFHILIFNILPMSFTVSSWNFHWGSPLCIRLNKFFIFVALLSLIKRNPQFPF